jgi:hypothetical protein
VFRIRDILVLIRVRCGSGSPDPYLLPTDPDGDPISDLALFVSGHQDANFVMLIPFLRYFYIVLQKVIKKSQNSRNQDFSSVFCLLM